MKKVLFYHYFIGKKQKQKQIKKQKNQTGSKGFRNFSNLLSGQGRLSLLILSLTLFPLEHIPSLHIFASFRELKEYIHSAVKVKDFIKGVIYPK